MSPNPVNPVTVNLFLDKARMSAREQKADILPGLELLSTPVNDKSITEKISNLSLQSTAGTAKEDADLEEVVDRLMDISTDFEQGSLVLQKLTPYLLELFKENAGTALGFVGVMQRQRFTTKLQILTEKLTSLKYQENTSNYKKATFDSDPFKSKNDLSERLVLDIPDGDPEYPVSAALAERLSTLRSWVTQKSRVHSTAMGYSVAWRRVQPSDALLSSTSEYLDTFTKIDQDFDKAWKDFVTLLVIDTGGTSQTGDSPRHSSLDDIERNAENVTRVTNWLAELRGRRFPTS